MLKHRLFVNIGSQITLQTSAKPYVYPLSEPG